MARKADKGHGNSIALNKKARFDYFIEETIEAGLALEGWEVKSLRAGRVQLKESYVTVKEGEAFLFGAHISALNTASTHIHPDPTRTRKLLLHRKELAKILAATSQKGLTCICTQLYWKGHLVKARIALAQGKKAHDKRDTEKERDWNRQKQRIMRDNVKQ